MMARTKSVLLGDVKAVLSFEREYQQALIDGANRFYAGNDAQRDHYVQERECIIAEIERIATRLGVDLESA